MRLIPRKDKDAPWPVPGERVVLRRRHFIAGAGTSLFVPQIVRADVLPRRELGFENIHTGERLTVEYWANGQYLPDALTEVSRLLRDFRTGQIHPIAPQLLDLLVHLRARLDTVQPVNVISGFRSPVTNAMLRAEHEQSGVASKSLHMQGMAIDIRIPGRELADIHLAALAARRGGVGYYPKSDFVHVDVGRVRNW